MNTKIRSIPFLFALVLTLSTLGITASTALAQKPVKSEFTWLNGPNAMDGICSFTVGQNGTVNVTEHDFYDQSGSLIRMDWHMVEQDTFHNVTGYNPDGTPIFGEKQLVGIPFTFNLQVLFDSQGNMTHAYADGVMEKIWLPDGSLFISAGQVDFAAHGFPVFILSPDHGNPGNIAGFCAALAP
jgi:hypothetical protein